jgi:transposase
MPLVTENFPSVAGLPAFTASVHRTPTPSSHSIGKSRRAILAGVMPAMVAPFVLDGPMNATSFMAYLKQCLAPTLKRGDIVMMDSLPVHKVAGVREVIEAAGARLRYLPKYSSDLNPIEQAFSKLKAHLRKAAERTIPRLSRRIGALTAKFSPQECANYLRHAGYAST